ncbi:hypothetical protein [Domibacillus robiginosus]|uniref:hypothetical protein n=1 Tax=Domibacillus robiginosus TaxID=1071054 RepID=UPI00067D56DB|nr:hypothetical protein [Domibacillus robiginosus]
MDTNLILILGKVMGELYDLQSRQGIDKADKGHIYGLKNGFEAALTKEFGDLSVVREEEVEAVYEYFSPFIEAETETDELPSIEEMRARMENKGISQDRFIIILRYLNACDRINVDVNQFGDFKLIGRH